MRFPPRYVDAVDFVDGAAQRTRVAARASLPQVHEEPERLQLALQLQARKVSFTCALNSAYSFACVTQVQPKTGTLLSL